ncbi:MAG: type II CRISPR RNA-guided endonuclease Cas9 [Bacilli bacterium]|nr:type II CRISPR RNA-guided endonuclease Cas9 [Bacilli bacterium]
MKKYTIGLDLGINNVGWAKYDLETKKVIDKGVVRFKESSTAQDRRIIRGSRRLRKRKQHRVERLAIQLSNINFCTSRSWEPELLNKRIKGLNESLSEQEITNIIYWFAIHRGYIPFDEEKPEREVHKFAEDEYPCQYIFDYYKEYGVYRGQCDLISLKDNLKELKQILLTQQKYHSKLTDHVIDNILYIIQSKREFWEGPGASKENQLSPYGRYRTLEDLEKYKADPTYHQYLYEMLIGKCELSIDKDGFMDQVAPKCNFYAEEFNFYNDFINMSVKEPSQIDEEYRNKITLKGKFTKDTIEEIKKEILNTKTVSLEKLVKKVLGLELKDIQGYRIDKKYKPEISKFEFYKYLLKSFKDKKLNPHWLENDDKTIYNQIIYILTVAPSTYAIEDMLKDRVKEVEFKKEEIDVLIDIKKKKNPDLKYHSLSERILKKALDDIKRHNCEYNFMQIMKRLEYEKEMKEYFQNNYSTKTQSPYTIEDQYIDHLIANPQVKKTLRKAIKVINAIIKKEKNYPETIVIESATSLNSKERKKQIEAEQKKYDKLNEEVKNELEANGYEATDKNMQLLINWKETNESCIYCGESISLKEVLTTEIEHILPKSKSMDNSHNNTTCSCLKCNKEKNNRTPYQYLTSENRYEGFKNRVMNQYDKMSQDKKSNLLFEGDIDKYSIKFINRNLRDTSYASVALVQELKKYNEYLGAKEGYKINIITSPGQLTSKIRQYLKIKDKDRTYLYHHVVDAMILASIPDTEIGKVLIEAQNDSQYWFKDKNKENKYKEEVYNMLNHVWLSNRDQIQKFNQDCDNMPEDNKDGLIKRSYEVLKNPIQQFSQYTEYAKYIKQDDGYYKILQVDNIYNLLIRKKDGSVDKDKQLLDELFDLSNKKTISLLCEKKDPKLYQKLKDIYIKNASSINPFVDECKYMYGLEEGDKFNYLKQGIRKTDNPNSPLVIRLRYLKRVTNPYIKNNITTRRKNVYNEFTINKPKKDTIIGLDGLKQVSTRIFYSYDDKKFIFLPICAISFVNGKLNKKEKNYQTTYNRLIGNKNVKEIGNIYTGEWVGVYKKNGEYLEGRYKGYHKTSNVLEYYINGLDTLSCVKICSSDLRIIIYTTDILGNRHIRLDTQKEI